METPLEMEGPTSLRDITGTGDQGGDARAYEVEHRNLKIAV